MQNLYYLWAIFGKTGNMEGVQVSIIIVNYNTSCLLENCLCSILYHVRDLKYEVIVVDNASSDNSLEMIELKYPWVRVVQSPENLGFGRANNLGFQYARGEMFFLLNTDIILQDNAAKILYDYMVKHPEVGMCGGQILQKDNTPGESFNYRWTVRREIYTVFTPICLQRLLNAWFYPMTSRCVRDVDNIVGADLMVSREVVEKTGGFDSDFFMYYEESEWANRVRRANYKVRFLPKTRIIHLQGASTKGQEQLKKRVYKEAWIGKFLYFYKVNGTNALRYLLYIHLCKCYLALLLWWWRPKKKQYWCDKRTIIQDSYKKALALVENHVCG